MSILRTGTTGTAAQSITVSGFSIASPYTLRLPVTLLPEDHASGVTLVSAVLIIAPDFGVTSDAYLATKTITTSPSAAGQITDAGASGEGALAFVLSTPDTALLTTSQAFWVTVTDSIGRATLLVRGAFVSDESRTNPLAAPITSTQTYLDRILAADSAARMAGDAATLAAAVADLTAEGTARDLADAATLASAARYADSVFAAEAIVRAQGDAATLVQAQSFASSADATLALGVEAARANGAAITLATAEAYADSVAANLTLALHLYADGGDANAIAVSQAYADARMAAEAALRMQSDTALGTIVSANTSAITALQSAQVSGLVGYATQAQLFANLVPPAGTVGYVNADPAPANNGFYLKAGATGTGSWTASPFDRVAAVEARVTALEGLSPTAGPWYGADYAIVGQDVDGITRAMIAATAQGVTVNDARIASNTVATASLTTRVGNAEASIVTLLASASVPGPWYYPDYAIYGFDAAGIPRAALAISGTTVAVNDDRIVANTTALGSLAPRVTTAETNIAALVATSIPPGPWYYPEFGIIGTDASGVMRVLQAWSSTGQIAVPARQFIPPTKWDVIAIAGQSNATNTKGQASLAIVPIATSAYLWNGASFDQLGPNGGFWGALAAAYYRDTGRGLLMVPTAYGGTSITLWAGPGNLWYDNAVASIDAALAAANADGSRLPTFGTTHRLHAIVWLQGESDIAVDEATYRPSFDAMTAAFFAHYGSNLRFCLLGLSTQDGTTIPGPRDAQRQAARDDARLFWGWYTGEDFAARGLLSGAGPHYVQSAYNAIGESAGRSLALQPLWNL